MTATKESKDVRSNTPHLTRQRKVVLCVVSESENHPTADEIFALAKKKLPTISYATVYNSLHYLKDKGLIRKINFGNAASRYDGETDRHDHAFCASCGKLVDFQMAEVVELMSAAARKTRFKPQTIHLTLTGLCSECRSD